MSPTARGPNGRPSKPQGIKVMIGGHFWKEVQTAMRMVAAENERTIQSLVAEGVAHVLSKYGYAAVAKVALDE